MPKFTEADWIAAYREKDALWIHDGNLMRPHAVLTSGKHSGGFFNRKPVIADDPLMLRAAMELTRHFIEAGGDIEKIDRVVGPQTGATRLAELIANAITMRRGRTCYWASPAKHEEDGVKSMVFDDPGQKVKAGEMVLLCEDVATTTGSIKLTADVVIKSGGVLADWVLLLVNRSGQQLVGGYNTMRIMALIDREMPIWEVSACPLCDQGSEALRPPKDPVNWAKLNAEY